MTQCLSVKDPSQENVVSRALGPGSLLPLLICRPPSQQLDLFGEDGKSQLASAQLRAPGQSSAGTAGGVQNVSSDVPADSRLGHEM